MPPYSAMTRRAIPSSSSSTSSHASRGAVAPHDDRLDALAMAVAYWTEYLNRDISREEDRRLEKLMELEYRRFQESVLGYSQAAPDFFDNY